MIVVYEVNLTVDMAVQAEFRKWLRSHTRLMLTLPGFAGAKLFEAERGSAGATTIQYVVQYLLESRPALQNYLNEHAREMRKQTHLRFGDSVIAHRRILLPL